MTIHTYDPGTIYDEMFAQDSVPRPHARLVADFLASLPPEQLHRKQQIAEQLLLHMGITFNVYGDPNGTEKIFPFDIVPRIVDEAEWELISSGLEQRVRALNAFLDDIYHAQKIVADGVIPGELIHSAAGFRPQCMGIDPPRGIWCHITGTDLVRDGSGALYVLEDNLRCPSGVSYMLANRLVMKRSFPNLFSSANVRPVDNYAYRLREALEHLAPDVLSDPRIVVLTPGIHNSAYYEHSFLAQQMGVPLVEGQDLIVDDGYVCMRTTRGLQRVDVIYRRIDDDFLDPGAFREDSALGVRSLMEVFRAGRVAIANAPGTGVADDKAIYAYVPDIIRYYLGEEIRIPNVPTYVCERESDRAYVLEHIKELVVKATNESGGYGMLIGPHASETDHEEFRRRITANPRGYIAQPTLSLSSAPILTEDRFEGRHVDLRPYIILGRQPYVTSGGLTRVALRKGSLVVNSSQGGGSKDTWVVPGDSQPQSFDRSAASAASAGASDRA